MIIQLFTSLAICKSNTTGEQAEEDGKKSAKEHIFV